MIDLHALSKRVIEILEQKGMTLAMAESCTGGLISCELTRVPGASKVIVGSVVAYANRIKTDILRVDSAIINARGAVDPDVAVQMAEGIRCVFNTDIGLSTTGIAGPDGGTPEKPVGLVYVGIAGSNCTNVYKLELNGDRDAIRNATAVSLLTHMMDYVAECGTSDSE